MPIFVFVEIVLYFCNYTYIFAIHIVSYFLY